MANYGYVKVCRSLQESDIWNERPFSRGQAWIDLIMLANYKDTKTIYKGEFIVCERGVVNLSITYLSKKWGWSRKKVSAFLKLLESDKMVTTNSTTHRTTITIENYSKYQDIITTNVSTNDTTSAQQAPNKRPTNAQQAHTTNKDKKDKKDKKDNKYIIKHKYGEYKNVLLTDEELSKLKNEYPDYEERIERLSEYIASTGKKYKSHLATIRSWARKDKPYGNKKSSEEKYAGIDFGTVL